MLVADAARGRGRTPAPPACRRRRRSDGRARRGRVRRATAAARPGSPRTADAGGARRARAPRISSAETNVSCPMRADDDADERRMRFGLRPANDEVVELADLHAVGVDDACAPSAPATEISSASSRTRCRRLEPGECRNRRRGAGRSANDVIRRRVGTRAARVRGRRAPRSRRSPTRPRSGSAVSSRSRRRLRCARAHASSLTGRGVSWDSLSMIER